MQLMLIAAAFAATPVIHAGDPTRAVQTASEAAGLPLWELRPVGVSELFPGEGALLVGAGQPAACAGPAVTNARLREIAGLAEKLLLRQSWSEVRARAAEANSQVACLSEGAEPSQLARLAFLEGYAAAEMGDSTAASAAFARALAWDPGMRWDDKFAGAGRAAFDALAANAGPRGTLHFGPASQSLGAVWAIDGRVISPAGSIQLAEGVHLVQTLQPAVNTWVVQIRARNPVALVSAPAARDQALTLASDEAQRGVLEAAIERSLGADARVVVLAGEIAWRVGDSWEPLRVPVAPPAPRPPNADRARLSGALVGGGGALTVLGGLGLVAGLVTSGEANQAEPDEPDGTYEWRNRLYKESQSVAVVGASAAALGLGALVVGVVVGKDPAPLQVGVAPMADGGVLLVSDRW